MVTALFYDHTEAQSCIAAAVIKNRFNDVVISDTAGLNEASIDGLIAALVATTYHRIYILVGVAAGHATGNITDAQILTLNGKLIGSGTDPDSDDACRQLGVNSGTLTPSWRTWYNTYPGISPAPIITYIGDIAKYTYTYGIATAGDSTSVTGTGTPFTASALIGKWVSIMSGTGIGDYGIITANTNAKITVGAGWKKDTVITLTNPGNNAVLCVYNSNHTDRVLANVYLPYSILAYLSDVADSNVFYNWQKLLDLNQNLLTSGRHYASWDSDYFSQVLSSGKACFDYANI
jgi:hypothetical protein